MCFYAGTTSQCNLYASLFWVNIFIGHATLSSYYIFMQVFSECEVDTLANRTSTATTWNANRQLHSKYNWPGRSRLDRAKKQTGKWRSSVDGLQSAGGWEKFSTGLGKIREGKAATLRIRIHEILGLFSRTKCF